MWLAIAQVLFIVICILSIVVWFRSRDRMRDVAQEGLESGAAGPGKRLSATGIVGVMLGGGVAGGIVGALIGTVFPGRWPVVAPILGMTCVGVLAGIVFLVNLPRYRQPGSRLGWLVVVASLGGAIAGMAVEHTDLGQRIFAPMVFSLLAATVALVAAGLLQSVFIKPNFVQLFIFTALLLVLIAGTIGLALRLRPREKPSLASLITDLQSAQVETRRRAADRLGGLGSNASAAADDLATLAVHDPEEIVRNKAADAFCKVGAESSSAKARLLDIVRSADSLSRGRAASLLRRVSLKTVLDALRDSDPAVREAVAVALGAPDPRVQSASSRSSSSFGQPSPLDTLVRSQHESALVAAYFDARTIELALSEASQDCDESVRREVNSSLCRVQERLVSLQAAFDEVMNRRLAPTRFPGRVEP